ncbi:MAG TPA: hypothetical protein VFH04_02705 [Nitrososphaeraceae archaeon]|nr:hypothetical protein [Nitrososphaeraceae archaeon]
MTQGIDDESEPEPFQQPNSGAAKVFQELDYVHVISLSNSPGNQIKLMLDYSVVDPSFIGQPMSGSMEVYATHNNPLIRTSSLSDPVLANKSGTLQFSTTFIDDDLENARTETVLTDSNGMTPISNRISANLTVGQIVER